MAARFEKQTGRAENQPASTPSKQDVRDALERILLSRGFQAAPAQSRFLRYTVEKTLEGGHDLKEYCIAIDVFGRDETFDQRRDSIVRIEARKMRRNLAKYYEVEGQHDPVQIEVPKGGYSPVFSLTGPAVTADDAPTPAPIVIAAAAHPRNFWVRLYRTPVAAGIATLLFVLPLYFMLHRTGRSGSGNTNRDKVGVFAQMPAHEDVLKGLFFFSKDTPEGVSKAIEYFNAAIDKESDYAPAYMGLAQSYMMLPLLCGSPVQGVVPTIRAAARKAEKLDPTLGEPHAALAWAADLEFDWSTAESEFGNARKLSPRDPFVHRWYARHLVQLGKLENALSEFRISSRFDPVSADAAQAIGLPLYLLRRYDEAVSQYQDALALDANSGSAHQGLGLTYLAMGRYEEGLEESKIAYRLMQADLMTTGQLGYAYALTGNKAMAQETLTDLLHRRHAAASSIAQIYIGLNDRDAAWQWLTKAYFGHDSRLKITPDPIYDNLRSDVRFVNFSRLYAPAIN
jgi:tetratricopeptide (TPR) repeat protein